jgi:serine O-acetyltransferase
MATDFLSRLAAERRGYTLPPRLRARAHRFGREVLALLFPHFASDMPSCAPDDLAEELACVRRTLDDVLAALPLPGGGSPAAATEAFVAALPAVYDALLDDARAILAGDPAAPSLDEVIAAYPGFEAIAMHRVAHVLHELGVPLLPRLVSEEAHRVTGIDIHPGARIGRGFSIDHGTGVVIGETAEIGDRVKLYQGVTLGAASVAKALARTKRHPTLEDDVVVYANATILGGDTVIGRGSIIGGNVWLTRSVPPESVVTHQSLVSPRRPTDDWMAGYAI